MWCSSEFRDRSDLVRSLVQCKLGCTYRQFRKCTEQLGKENRGNEPSQFEPLHEDVVDINVIEQPVSVEERPTLMSLDVDLHHGVSKVDYFQQVVHDNRCHVRRAAVVAVTRGSSLAELVRLPADVGSALVVKRHAELERASDVRHRILDDNDLRTKAQT